MDAFSAVLKVSVSLSNLTDMAATGVYEAVRYRDGGGETSTRACQNERIASKTSVIVFVKKSSSDCRRAVGLEVVTVLADQVVSGWLVSEVEAQKAWGDGAWKLVLAVFVYYWRSTLSPRRAPSRDHTGAEVRTVQTGTIRQRKSPPPGVLKRRIIKY